jgi:hypothetical protein
MKLENRLNEVSDDALLDRMALLVRRQNSLTAALLAHIGEVDRRRLYLREACSSMHRYCVERLGLSDGAAYKRIHAARAARRFPVLLAMVERGELHLKGITLLAPHLTDANCREVLARARHQPVRAIEKLVAELAPRPAVSPRLRALPRSPTKPAPAREAPSTQVREARSAQPARSDEAPAPLFAPAPASPSTPTPTPAALPLSAQRSVTPLAPRRYELRITIDESAHADLTQLQDLLGHQIPDRNPAAIVSRALALLVDRTLARKAGMTDRARSASKSSATGEPHGAGNAVKRSRHIPAETRRTVWSRDGGRCAFRDGCGRRCTATSQLEFHHLDNFARGADHAPDRLELRCRAHNLYQAKLDYGEAFIEAARAGRDRAREHSPTYQLRRSTRRGESTQRPSTSIPRGTLPILNAQDRRTLSKDHNARQCRGLGGPRR